MKRNISPNSAEHILLIETAVYNPGWVDIKRQQTFYTDPTWQGAHCLPALHTPTGPRLKVKIQSVNPGERSVPFPWGAGPRCNFMLLGITCQAVYHPCWKSFLSAEIQWELPLWKLLPPRRSSLEGICGMVLVCKMNSQQLITSVFLRNVQMTKCSSGELRDIINTRFMDLGCLSLRWGATQARWGALWLIFFLAKKLNRFLVDKN